MVPAKGKQDVVKAIVGILTAGQHGELLVVTAMRALDDLITTLGANSTPRQPHLKTRVHRNQHASTRF